ncbi:MAG: SUMF1/EgtB/PvdO family nonheme iron enzyme [Anaerolineae bacterium]|nr:SUMF1/EgtB/PvdO family nonheme iron enzyme [Anaerolineae bacterium]NUQ06488.1 SUMF1/EgtB/PvdO family nonheme iron enzyme [Anaerolineae bacterium]
MATPKPLRVFLSSPGDVSEERDLTQQVVESLRSDPEFNAHFELTLFRWDDLKVRLPMDADATPQKSVDVYMIKPSECDLVVVIFGVRMGTPLIMDEREYLSGTHYEYSSAIEAKLATGRPRVWLYHSTRELDVKASDPQREVKLAQYDLVQEFFAGFRDAEGRLKGGITEYEKPSEYAEMFAGQMRTFLATIRDHPERLIELTDEADGSARNVPYKGLEPLEEDDEAYFFGRERERLEVLALLRHKRFVVIIGASGSGKSSLAAAGVLPRIRSRRNWRIARTTPGSDPFRNLAESLVSQAPELSRKPNAVVLEALRAGGEKLDELLQSVLAKGVHLLLFVDQLEELFTLGEKAQGREAVEAYARLLQYDSPRFTVLATLRADFYEAAMTCFVKKPSASNFDLGRPSAFALREMIERPAKRAKLKMEDDLAELIVEEVNDQPGALPLVAYLLAQMYERMVRWADRAMTRAHYDSVGGVRGAISTVADATYDELELPEERKSAALKRVFRVLVELTEEQGKLVPTRRRADRASLMSDPDASLLVDKLTAARLLTADRDAVEVAHEALFTSWATLEEWIAEVQDDLRMVRQFERDAREWVRRGRPLELRPRNDQLRLLLNSAEHLQETITHPLVVEYADLDVDHLLEEIQDLATTHERRLFIGERLGLLGDPRPGVGNKKVTIDGRTQTLPDIAWCYVEAKRDARGRYPRLNVGGNHEIRPFWIARYPVTRQQFQAFLDDPEGYTNRAWWSGTPANLVAHQKFENRGRFPTSPCDNITWYQAMAFSRWLHAHLTGLTLQPPAGADLPSAVIGEGLQIRLPNEWEWLWAAQAGPEAREYPWRGAWDSQHANTREASLGESTLVGMYPGGAAACGAEDMGGNLWDWCLNGFFGGILRRVRGGSFLNNQYGTRRVLREQFKPDLSNVSVGFRVVCAVDSI